MNIKMLNLIFSSRDRSNRQLAPCQGGGDKKQIALIEPGLLWPAQTLGMLVLPPHTVQIPDTVFTSIQLLPLEGLGALPPRALLWGMGRSRSLFAPENRRPFCSRTY